MVINYKIIITIVWVLNLYWMHYQAYKRIINKDLLPIVDISVFIAFVLIIVEASVARRL